MQVILLCLCLLYTLPLFSQQHLLTESYISFYSSAPVEDIEAATTRSKSLFNAETGDIAFVIPINTFEFNKKLMQEHFNESYLESHKYPEATFKGKLVGFNPQQQGVQNVMAKGEMKIHGVSRQIETEGTLEFMGKEVHMAARFPIRLADYQVEIPKLVMYNIAEVVDVKIKAKYLPYEKK